MKKEISMGTFQWIIFGLSVIGFIVFLAPVFTGIFNIGNGAGLVFFAVLSILSIKWQSLFALLKEHRLPRIIFSAACALAAVFFAAAVIISVFMIKAAENKPVFPSAFIVLGCRVKGDRPSLMLEKRINAAYEYLIKYPDAFCILSGGQGSDETMSEAECMYRELTSKGISADRLIKEENSVNTYENIKFSKALLESYGISGEITIVTSEFHQCRAGIIAEKQGLDVSAVSARTALFLLPTYWVRDCLGTAYEMFLN